MRFGILLLCCFFSCSKKQVEPPKDPGLDYYPLTKGKFVVFQVDSVVYNEIPRDTFHFSYQIKEVLADTFYGTDGKLLWRLERWIRQGDLPFSNDSLLWQPKDVWSVDADGRRIVINEENRRVTRLVFPVKEGTTWNGNAANNDSRTDFRYEYVDRQVTVGAEQFSQTLKVTQKNFRTLISLEYQAEQYAKGTGLVYKEFRELFSNTILAGKPVEDRIEHGVTYTQSLIAHGIE